MLNSLRLSQSLRFGAVLLALAAIAGCRGITDDDDNEVPIAAVRLTIGTQTVTINQETGAQSNAVTLAANAPTAITAVALRADGQVETLVTAADFELRVTPVTNNVTFTRTGPFSGTITRTAAGAATVQVSFWHLAEGHPEFGPHNLTFN
jgi:hypothetical protein